MSYKAKRSFTAGRDKKGNLISFEANKVYNEIPEKTSRYFIEVESKKKSESKGEK